MAIPVRRLIRGATIVSLDPSIGDLPCGDILVSGDRIEAVAPSIQASDVVEVIEAQDAIAIPGLINGHMHTWQTALRGTVGDMTLVKYFSDVHFGVARMVTPDDTYVSTLVGALNQINSGVTSLFDWHHANHSIEHTDAAVDALVESGIRAVYGHGISRPQVSAESVAPADLLHPRHRIERLRKGRLASDEGRVTLAMCILGPGLSPFKVTQADIRLARELKLLWSLHTGALGFPSVTENAIPQMAQAGLLGQDGNFVHANTYSDDDLRQLIDGGASISITPEIEMQFGHGIPVIGRVVAFGGIPSIGVDIESLHVGDMFMQMRAALQSHRGFDNMVQPKPIRALPSTTRDALRWATLGNARAMGLESRIGSLTPGKQADIILIRKTDLNMIPVHDPVQSIVLQAGAHNVDTVLIEGQIMKRAGKLTIPPEKLANLTGRLEVCGRRLASHLPS